MRNVSIAVYLIQKHIQAAIVKNSFITTLLWTPPKPIMPIDCNLYVNWTSQRTMLMWIWSQTKVLNIVENVKKRSEETGIRLSAWTVMYAYESRRLINYGYKNGKVIVRWANMIRWEGKLSGQTWSDGRQVEMSIICISGSSTMSSSEELKWKNNTCSQN